MFSAPYHLVRPMLPQWSDLEPALSELYQSRMLTNQAANVRTLEKRLAERLQVNHCALFCNGTTALMTLLRCLDVAGEVILPSFTFAATAQAVHWQGITPVFADIRQDDLTMDPDHVQKLITDRTSAILPVNIFGRICDHERLDTIAQAHGLPLIYDSAQAFGALYRDKPVGSFGLAEVFSFHATKIFHTGEGGCVTTNDASLYEKLCRTRNFGFEDYLNCTGPGLNGKMSEFSAVVGLKLLDLFDEHISKREWVFRQYQQSLATINGITLPRACPCGESNFSYFYVFVDEKEFGLTNLELNYALIADNIVSRCYFYPPVHRTTFFQNLAGETAVDLPITDWAATHVLCLPVYSDMQMFELAKIIQAIELCQQHAQEIRQALSDKIPKDWEAMTTNIFEDPHDRFILDR